MTLRFSNTWVVAVAAMLLSLTITSCKGGDDQEYPISISSQKTSLPSASGDEFIIEIRCDSDWTIDLKYEGTQSDWASVTPASGRGSTKEIAFKYTSNPSDQPRSVTVAGRCGHESAYVTLTQMGNRQMLAPTWLELPAVDKGEGYDFFYHSMTSGFQTKRNYSFYWSEKDMLSLWVAYPMNSDYRNGSMNRSEAWGPDPLLVEAGIKQPDVSFTFTRNVRGHQIPSADRYQWDSNAQTFYSTNITPQDYNFNGGIWVALENRLRNVWMKGLNPATDTLYVVTGCVVDGAREYSSSKGDNSIKITIPTAYYKAVLMYRPSMKNVGNAGYLGCGVFLDHYGSYPEDAKNSSGEDLKKYSMSISDLEKKIGIDLYPHLAERVGSKDLAATIESQDPQSATNSQVWWK